MSIASDQHVPTTIVSHLNRVNKRYVNDEEMRQCFLMVITIAKKYAYTPDDLLDAIQEGNIGVLNALNSFDPDRSDNFKAHAMMNIKSQIRNSRRDKFGSRLNRRNKCQAEFIDGDDAPEACESPLESLEKALVLQKAVESLDEREQNVIVGRLCGSRLETLGKEMGMTHGGVSYIQKEALGKLKIIIGAV